MVSIPPNQPVNSSTTYGITTTRSQAAPTNSILLSPDLSHLQRLTFSPSNYWRDASSPAGSTTNRPSIPTPSKSHKGVHGWPGNEHSSPFIGAGELGAGEQRPQSEAEDEEEEDELQHTTDSETDIYVPYDDNPHAGPSRLQPPRASSNSPVSSTPPISFVPQGTSSALGSFHYFPGRTESPSLIPSTMATQHGAQQQTPARQLPTPIGGDKHSSHETPPSSSRFDNSASAPSNRNRYLGYPRL